MIKLILDLIKYSTEINGKRLIVIGVIELQNDMVRVSVYNTGKNFSEVDEENLEHFKKSLKIYLTNTMVNILFYLQRNKFLKQNSLEKAKWPMV